MKNSTWLLFMSILLLMPYGCGSNDQAEVVVTDSTGVDTVKFLKDLENLEAKINLNLASPDKQVLRQAVTTFQDYAAIFPTRKDVPDYLLRASDYSLSTGQVEKSVKILERIMAEYPDYLQMEDVMFSRASHLDFELRDTTRAKEAYQDFIEKFPNSTNKVLDAQYRIQTISLTLEELGNQFVDQLESEDIP